MLLSLTPNNEAKNVDGFLAQVIDVHSGVGISVQIHSNCWEMPSLASDFEEQGVPLCTYFQHLTTAITGAA